MPFLLVEILNFQGSTHQYGVGSFSIVIYENEKVNENLKYDLFKSILLKSI